MNSALKHTIIALAAAALSVTAACKSDEGAADPVALEVTAGAEAEASAEAAAEGEPVQARRDAKKAGKDAEKAAEELGE